MRHVLSGLALLAAIWLVPASFADKAPPTIPNPKPTHKPEPKPAPIPEPAPPVASKNCDLLLEDFMDPKIKGTIKNTTLTKEQVDARLTSYYKDLLNMVPDPKWNEGTTSWKKLVEKTIDKKSWGASCKTCHKAFESMYDKAHNDKKVCFTPIP
jgi:hypothetical protein